MVTISEDGWDYQDAVKELLDYHKTFKKSLITDMVYELDFYQNIMDLSDTFYIWVEENHLKPNISALKKFIRVQIGNYWEWLEENCPEEFEEYQEINPKYPAMVQKLIHE